MIKQDVIDLLGGCRIERVGENIEITRGAMYGAPELNFDLLVRLSNMFGTKQIDIDNYGKGGCETCDYGSEYGHTIQIKHPTIIPEDLT